MKLQAVIFDLDGVLTDTVPMHYRAWKRLFDELDVNFTPEIYRKSVDGIPRLEGIKNMLPDASSEELVKFAERKQRYYLEELDKTPPEVFDDALFLMEELTAHNVKIAVASSSKNCLNILGKLGIGGIHAVVAGNDVQKGKPAPDIFLKAAELLGVCPAGCLVIEDAILGIRAAKAAGMRCIMICRGKEEIEASQTDLTLKSLRITCAEIRSRLRFSSENISQGCIE